MSKFFFQLWLQVFPPDIGRIANHHIKLIGDRRRKKAAVFYAVKLSAQFLVYFVCTHIVESLFLETLQEHPFAARGFEHPAVTAFSNERNHEVCDGALCEILSVLVLHANFIN